MLTRQICDAEPMRQLLSVFTKEPGTIPMDKAQ